MSTTDGSLANRARFWLFMKLSVVGWRICPEPQRSRLIAQMPSWNQIKLIREIREREAVREALEAQKEPA